ncbi:BgTH12-03092 [Blumeria graminis f. sp. triticale]|uniref:Post-GPI attachment to proteins factor 3 n=1 Tax=Blumeria graminis f. sp. triticale TaxID=1689686 RepID=A0A9W4D3X8_BLUGR|nr:BgTH12-03092 [Blumeria graminis f. sp. triticale]
MNGRSLVRLPSWLFLSAIFIFGCFASYGDRLPEFQQCVQTCTMENCHGGSSSISVLHRILLWNCDSECDYTCQHIITAERTSASKPVVQFHGKWPFYRFLGIQEPFSVLFSFLNLLAHQKGLSKLVNYIPASYPMRRYYIMFAYIGMASWTFSILFHTRDFKLTEQLDYFAAGGSILYGLYYTPIRIFRMDQGIKEKSSLLRAWTSFCIIMYVVHVAYLKLYRWDYTYNMAANVVVGVIHNAMWSWFSLKRYRKLGEFWATWPGIAVAWILMAMSLELLDFPPLWGCLDAHSLWHMGTIGPTILWYNFLLKDAEEDMATHRLKA